MYETNEPKRQSDADRLRAERRKKRIAQKRRQKQLQQLAALAGLILFVLVAIILICTVLGKVREGKQPEQTTGQTQTTAAATTEATTAATTEPAVTEPTLPEVTWMTFPADRELLAQQYFVYSCDDEEFLTLSGELSDTIYPASVTKLFTAYVAMQYLDPEQVITAGDALDLVAAGSSVAEIEKGDKITAEMLVEAMLLPSGNDAAYILAVEAGRLMADDASLSARSAADLFVEEMNAQAKDLGMTGTNFANPDGIHRDSHYTTFRDLAIMGSLSLENETVLKYANVSKETVVFENGTEKQWKNTNSIIDPDSEYYCPYAVGLKTGQTPRAGSCLLSAFTCNGRTLIIGVFGCPEQEDRFADTLQLFNEAMGFGASE